MHICCSVVSVFVLKAILSLYVAYMWHSLQVDGRCNIWNVMSMPY